MLAERERSCPRTEKTRRRVRVAAQLTSLQYYCRRFHFFCLTMHYDVQRYLFIYLFFVWLHYCCTVVVRRATPAPPGRVLTTHR